MTDPIKTRMRPLKGEAVVRMYCTGLGDCFLLGLPAEGRTCYVLIDCGAWMGTPGVKPWMEQIMGHIANEVGEAGIDLLVVTHPHWDHLSGFMQARDIFEKIKVNQVWLPWTEDPNDRTALMLAEERRMTFLTAVAAVSELTLRLGPDKVAKLKHVLQLADDSPDGMSALLGVSTEDLLAIVRKKVDKPCYVRPSLKPLALAGISGFRIYALGPPTNLKLLGRDDPSTAPGKSEVYLKQSRPITQNEALLAAVRRPYLETQADLQYRERAYPFDGWLRKSPTDSNDGPLFHSRYREGLAWRQIDTDWLETANQLALNLDDHVNNTSLALAFELGENGPVLLFPGDAQVGNWLSWHELESVNGMTAKSLLNRTVLYKVGHHGSHNATLKDMGLKMMIDTTRLVAMIPVDQVEASKKKGKNENGWAMPYDKLLADLQARTEGRIIRADSGWEEPAQGVLDEEQTKRWKQFDEDLFWKKELHGDQERFLFIQHTIRPERPRSRRRGRSGV